LVPGFIGLIVYALISDYKPGEKELISQPTTPETLTVPDRGLWQYYSRVKALVFEIYGLNKAFNPYVLATAGTDMCVSPS
jgi:hypothetical protein